MPRVPAYFDTRTRCWQLEVFAEIAPELDPQRVLPRLLEAHEPAGMVRPLIARELGLGDNVVVSFRGRRQHAGGDWYWQYYPRPDNP